MNRGNGQTQHPGATFADARPPLELIVIPQPSQPAAPEPECRFRVAIQELQLDGRAMSQRSAFSGLVGRFHSEIQTLIHKGDVRRISFGERLIALDRIAGTTFLGCVMVLAISLLSQTVGPLNVPGAIADSEDGITTAAPKPTLSAIETRIAAMPLSSTDVRRLQTRLKGLGFDPGPIDGMAGGQTLDALNRYRETRHLSRASQVDHASIADLLD